MDRTLGRHRFLWPKCVADIRKGLFRARADAAIVTSRITREAMRTLDTIYT